MTRPTLTVVEGGGKPEPDTEFVEARKVAASVLTEATAFWVYARYEDGSYKVRSAGPEVAIHATVEEIGRDLKLKALGLWGDDE